MNIKYTQKEVEGIFSFYGYYLKGIYKGNKIKMLTICPKGHEYLVHLNAFNNGNRCSVCAGKKKYTQEEATNIFLKEGYLLKDFYKNNKNKLLVNCPKGHNWSISLNGFMTHGYRCSTCSGNKRYSISDAEQIFAKEGYSIINGNYLNNRSRLLTVCPKQHEWESTLFGFNAGYRCSTCSGNKKYTQKEVESVFSLFGYTLKDKYKNNKSNMTVLCPKGHEIYICFQDFNIKESRCGECHNQTVSKPEIFLFNTIKNIYSDVKKIRDKKVKIKDKPYIYGFEIDIFIPSLNLGIEFDGTRYHSFKYMREDKSKIKWSDEDIRNYHEIKDNWFASKGIKILHIKEEDWKKDKQACINKCLTFLGIKWTLNL